MGTSIIDDYLNVSQKARNSVSPAENSLRFPSNEKLLYGIAFKFIKYEYSIGAGKGNLLNKISGAHIMLPLPTALVENLSLSYDLNSLGAAGKMYNVAYGSSKDLLSGLNDKSTTSDLMNQLTAKFSTSGAINAAVNTGEYVVRSLAGNILPGLDNAIDLQQGNVINPYTIATFHQADNRKHSLNFKLIPTCGEDSTRIKDICDEFKLHALPSIHQQFFLTMPDEVEICYFGSDFLYRFARCVITNITINHAPYGVASFFGDDDAPTAVDFTVDFDEIEALTQESYGDQKVKMNAVDGNITNAPAIAGVNSVTPAIAGGASDIDHLGSQFAGVDSSSLSTVAWSGSSPNPIVKLAPFLNLGSSMGTL